MKILLVATAVVSTALLVPVDAAQAAGVCADIDGCEVVAHVDVDGDGLRDAVGLVRDGDDGAPQGSVQLRVRTDDALVTVRRKTSYWYGDLWHGAADVDGVPGKELFVGYTSGAHTLFFNAVTWRDGDLATMDAPGRGRHWIVDAAYTVSYGWLHRAKDPAGMVKKRFASRNGDTERFRGTVTTFRWQAGGWQRRHVHRYPSLTAERAYSWAGFHVRGLPRGLR